MPYKLTDKEIVKALPKVRYGGHGCAKCKYDNGKGEDRCGLKGCKIARYALDLINRLQEENERLKTEKDNLIRTYSECQIANLQEFMHRAENKLANNTDISMVGYQSVICDMEEVYKELVGDSNAKEKE